MKCKARIARTFQETQACGEPAVKHELCQTCLNTRRDILARQIFELKQSLVVKQAELEDLA